MIGLGGGLLGHGIQPSLTWTDSSVTTQIQLRLYCWALTVLLATDIFINLLIIDLLVSPKSNYIHDKVGILNQNPLLKVIVFGEKKVPPFINRNHWLPNYPIFKMAAMGWWEDSVSASKPDDPDLIPRAHMIQRGNQLPHTGYTYVCKQQADWEFSRVNQGFYSTFHSKDQTYMLKSKAKSTNI